METLPPSKVNFKLVGYKLFISEVDSQAIILAYMLAVFLSEGFFQGTSFNIVENKYFQNIRLPNYYSIAVFEKSV